MSTFEAHVARIFKISSYGRRQLVHGFMRQINDDINIPQRVVQFVSAYFDTMIECFDKSCKGSEIELHGSLNRFCRSSTQKQKGRSVRGTVVASNGKHHWKLKVVQWEIPSDRYAYRPMTLESATQYFGSLIIGIVESSVDISNGIECYSYGFDLSKNQIMGKEKIISSKVGIHVGDWTQKKGQIFNLYLDFDEHKGGTLMFEANKNYIGKGVIHGLMKGNSYRLLISLPSHGTALKILEHNFTFGSSE